MKNTIIVALTCIAVGFAAGWLAKPETVAEDRADVAARSASRAHSPSSSSRASSGPDTDQAREARRTSGGTRTMTFNDGEMDEETKKAMEEAQRQQNDMIRKRFGDQFDMRIAAMVKELGLDPSQEKALKAFYAEQLEKLSFTDGLSGMPDMERMKEMAAAIRGDGLNDHMKTLLSEDQMDGLMAMQERKKKSKIESRAMKSLAKLQQTLDLTDDQKDGVYGVFIDDAEKSLASQSDADYVTRAMMSGMGVEMDMGDMDMGSVMQLHSGNDDGEAIDRAAFIKQMKADRQKRIDDKVARLASVLDETQQQQYRKSLESKGGMFNMMIQGMEDAAEGEAVEVEPDGE